MKIGETLVVGQTTTGSWPDPTRWMSGRNEATGKAGEFPGPYTEFVEEFVLRHEPEPEVELPSPSPVPPGRDTPTHDDVPPPVPRRIQSASSGTHTHPLPPWEGGGDCRVAPLIILNEVSSHKLLYLVGG